MTKVLSTLKKICLFLNFLSQKIYRKKLDFNQKLGCERTDSLYFAKHATGCKNFKSALDESIGTFCVSSKKQYVQSELADYEEINQTTEGKILPSLFVSRRRITKSNQFLLNTLINREKQYLCQSG